MESLQIVFDKKAKTSVPIHDLIAKRWSGRAFDPERDITLDQIFSMIEAARWAPSCYGDQPWRYIICHRATNPAAWERACLCLVEGNRSWAQNAPLFFIAAANTELSKNDNPNRWGEYDTGAASENLSLQAASMELIVHQMGGFDPDLARASFSIPVQYTPMAVIAVGYQLEEASIPDDIKEREYAERQRNDPGENFFDGNWGAAFTKMI